MLFIHIVTLLYWQLLLVGVHIGHTFKNSIAFSGWLVYTYKQNILIINLFKTLLVFKNGYYAIDSCIRYGHSIWFVSLDRAFSLYVTYFAKICGEFGYSTYWINGMLSNWISLAKTFFKFQKRTYNSRRGKFFRLEFKSSPWFLTRWSWPRTCLLPSAYSSAHPSKECSDGAIGCIGIVDTNASGHITNMAVPGNDDSLDCIVLYNSHISGYILEGKFRHVITWYAFVRKKKRSISFYNWLLSNYLLRNSKLDVKKFINRKKFTLNKLRVMKENINKDFFWSKSYLGLKFFFFKNAGFTDFTEQVDVYSLNKSTVNITKTYNFEFMNFFIKKFIYIAKLFSFYVIQGLWFFHRYIKKYNISEKKFKLMFLTGFKYHKYDKKNINFYLQRFRRNRFYKTLLKRRKFRYIYHVIKYVKLIYLRKYAHYRGFFKKDTSNFTKSSTFFYVFLYKCSFFYKNLLFKTILLPKRWLKPKPKLDNKILHKFYRYGLRRITHIHFLALIKNNIYIKKQVKFFIAFKGFILIKRVVKFLSKKILQSIYLYFNFKWYEIALQKQLEDEDPYILNDSLKLVKLNRIFHKFRFINIVKNSTYQYYLSKFLLKYKCNSYKFLNLLRKKINIKNVDLRKKFFIRFFRFVNLRNLIDRLAVSIRLILPVYFPTTLWRHFRRYYWNRVKSLKRRLRMREIIEIFGNTNFTPFEKSYAFWRLYQHKTSAGIYSKTIKYIYYNKMLYKLSEFNKHYNSFDFSNFFNFLNLQYKTSFNYNIIRDLHELYRLYYLKMNLGFFLSYQEFKTYRFNLRSSFKMYYEYVFKPSEFKKLGFYCLTYGGTVTDSLRYDSHYLTGFGKLLQRYSYYNNKLSIRKYFPTVFTKGLDFANLYYNDLFFSSYNLKFKIKYNSWTKDKNLMKSIFRFKKKATKKFFWYKSFYKLIKDYATELYLPPSLFTFSFDSKRLLNIHIFLDLIKSISLEKDTKKFKSIFSKKDIDFDFDDLLLEHSKYISFLETATNIIRQYFNSLYEHSLKGSIKIKRIYWSSYLIKNYTKLDKNFLGLTKYSKYRFINKYIFLSKKYMNKFYEYRNDLNNMALITLVRFIFNLKNKNINKNFKFKIFYQ